MFAATVVLERPVEDDPISSVIVHPQIFFVLRLGLQPPSPGLDAPKVLENKRYPGRSSIALLGARQCRHIKKIDNPRACKGMINTILFYSSSVQTVTQDQPDFVLTSLKRCETHPSFSLNAPCF